MSVGNGLPIMEVPMAVSFLPLQFLGVLLRMSHGEIALTYSPTIPLPHQSHHSTHSITNNEQMCQGGVVSQRVHLDSLGSTRATLPINVTTLKMSV
jgi:hypothetical protein